MGSLIKPSVWTVSICVVVAGLMPVVCAGCGQKQSKAKSQSAASGNMLQTPVAPAPSSPILFQPMFVWKSGEPTFQGTGFFVKAPNGRIAAVTSAHFLDMDGPPLLEATWLTITTGQPLATFSQSWGKPGRAGTDKPVLDLRSDYLLMPAPDTVPPELVLELDPRPQPNVNERIWFPNKDNAQAVGYRVVAGTVRESDVKYCVVVLDQEIALQSQSGSPFISQTTGKVIGTLAKADRGLGKTRLMLAPSNSMLDVLNNDQELPALHAVIGK